MFPKSVKLMRKTQSFEYYLLGPSSPEVREGVQNSQSFGAHLINFEFFSLLVSKLFSEQSRTFRYEKLLSISVEHLMERCGTTVVE